ncbi:DinI-like family protein [Morganella morganii]|uniref:DinI-like family protein n=1 Tax=Morganella TaxID=581 RepID=UPI00370AB424
MLRINVIFDKALKDTLPTGTFDALRDEIEKRIPQKYQESDIRIAWGSNTNFSVDGLKKGDKKEDLETLMQEIWEDDGWMPEMADASDDVEYFDK